MGRVVFVFLILLSILSFMSINNSFTRSFENPYILNVERISIEKEFNCVGISCIDLIPFESKSFFGISDASVRYKDNDKDYYVVELNKPIKKYKFWYLFFKDLEGYFHLELAQLIWLFTLIFYYFRKKI